MYVCILFGDKKIKNKQNQRQNRKNSAVSIIFTKFHKTVIVSTLDLCSFLQHFYAAAYRVSGIKY